MYISSNEVSSSQPCFCLAENTQPSLTTYTWPAQKWKERKYKLKTNHSSVHASGSKVKQVLTMQWSVKHSKLSKTVSLQQAGSKGTMLPMLPRRKTTKWSPFAHLHFCLAGAPHIQPRNTTLWPWFDSLISVFSCSKVSQNSELNWLSKPSLNLPLLDSAWAGYACGFWTFWIGKWTPNEAYDSLLESLDPKI